MKNTRRPSLELLEHARRDALEVAALLVAVAQLCVCWLAQGQTTRRAAAPMTSSTGQAERSSGRTKRLSRRPAANQITISLSRYMRDERADDGDEQRQAEDRRQVAEHGVAHHQHDVARLDAAAGRQAERADQHHRHHDGQDHHQRRAEAARQLFAQRRNGITSLALLELRADYGLQELKTLTQPALRGVDSRRAAGRRRAGQRPGRARQATGGRAGRCAEVRATSPSRPASCLLSAAAGRRHGARVVLAAAARRCQGLRRRGVGRPGRAQGRRQQGTGRRLGVARADHRRAGAGAGRRGRRRALRVSPHQAERAGGVEAASGSAWPARKAGRPRCARACSAARPWPRASTLAREWANRPANHCTPTLLADEARRLGKAFGLQVRGAGPQGSRQARHGLLPGRGPGRRASRCASSSLRYHGAAKSDAPVVLVGKGITFDTGGISIKPAAEMDEMKFDMCGAASVLGTFRALARTAAEAQRGGPDPGVREHARRRRAEAGRRGHQHERPDHRGAEHRRRGPADPVRRADLRRALQAARPWSTSPR